MIEDIVMTNIRDSISRQVSACPDERSRITLLPTAVRLTHGGVCDAGVLLQDAPTQAVLGYTGGCRLENVPGEEKAGILLDYGRESHGTLCLTSAAVESASGRALTGTEKSRYFIH